MIDESNNTSKRHELSRLFPVLALPNNKNFEEINLDDEIPTVSQKPQTTVDLKKVEEKKSVEKKKKKKNHRSPSRSHSRHKKHHKKHEKSRSRNRSRSNSRKNKSTP